MDHAGSITIVPGSATTSQKKTLSYLSHLCCMAMRAGHGVHCPCGLGLAAPQDLKPTICMTTYGHEGHLSFFASFASLALFRGIIVIAAATIVVLGPDYHTACIRLLALMMKA